MVKTLEKNGMVYPVKAFADITLDNPVIARVMDKQFGKTKCKRGM